jgi:hypothetical protein
LVRAEFNLHLLGATLKIVGIGLHPVWKTPA